MIDFDSLGSALQHDPLVAIGLLFAAGIVTSLTPCVYPMIPITAGIIGGSAGPGAGRGRVAALTAAYVTGLATLYATAGLIAGLSGQLFGTLAASWWTRGLVALLLTAFGLALLDVFPVPVPRRLLDRVARLKGGSVPAVFLLGATSGLVAAPCGAPAFAAVLTWVSTTGSGTLGFVYLFVFSLGMTALLVAVGMSAGLASRLPRPGRWTMWIKTAGGIILLAMAAFYYYQAWLVR
ncbi:MAG: sulfite exporter TauE/SafE family protein [Gemmatimonadota bacterium]|nr:sulfite exporter TauE/SafE family protein [Gemmatimonadota bacterium]